MIKGNVMFDNPPPDMLGLTNQEMEIAWFLWFHKEEQITEAMAECLGYLWTGRKLH